MIPTFDFPGCGLAGAPDIGVTFPIFQGFDYCRIYGILLNVLGKPVGNANYTTKMENGKLIKVYGWQGVEISASFSASDTVNGKVVTVSKTTTTTNESGYFELFVIKGLTVTITCSVLGKSVSLNTTNLDSIDLGDSF